MNNMWKKCKLSDIGNIVGGATPSTKEEEYYGGEIPWLTPKDLSSYHERYITNGERNITEEGLRSCSAQLLPSGSVLFSSRAPIGYVAIAKNPIATNQGFKSVIPNENTDSLFLYYLLKYNKEKIDSMGSGTTFKEVSGATMKNIKVTIPSSLYIQKRIANILGSIDDKIELNNRINLNLEEQAQALFRRWFVDFEFPNEQGLPYKSNGGTFVDSELGRIPKKWSVKTIADVAELTAGGDKPSVVANKPTGECSVPIFSNGISDEGLYGYTTNAKIFKESVTISARGTIGFVRLRQEPFLPIVRLITATPKTDFVSAKYLYLLLLDKNISGTGTTQQQLTVPDFGRYELIVPTLSVIKKFNKIANVIYDYITFSKHENENLEYLRDTFLPKLMNNEIKL